MIPAAFLFMSALSVNALPPARPDLSSCILGQGSVAVHRKADLPSEVQSALARLFDPDGGIAETSEFFEASDAPGKDSKAPTARFVRAYHVRETWIVWFERGGIVLSRQTVAFVPRPQQSSGQIELDVAPGSFFQGDLCAASKAFLAGARSAG